MKEEIRDRARQLGFDECRFTTAHPPESGPQFTDWLAQGRHGEMAYLARNAPRRLEPRRVLPGIKSVIALASSYSGPENQQAPGPNPASGGVVARYACFQDYHEVLGEKLQSLAGFVAQTGGKNVSSLWYVDTGPVLERDLAQRAGLGFIGKHTNLISRRLGNWIFLSELLTTLELKPDEPERNHCGSCSRCLSACPTGAIVAPFQLDARRCISYLTIELKGSIPVQLRPALGNRIYGCDDCLAACPWNRFARVGALMQAHARADLKLPDLLELLGMDETAFRRRFAGTPLLRARRRGLLRNVCVALGNVGDARALPVLRRAASGPDALIAEHAEWAIRQIELRDTASAAAPPRPAAVPAGGARPPPPA